MIIYTLVNNLARCVINRCKENNLVIEPRIYFSMVFSSFAKYISVACFHAHDYHGILYRIRSFEIVSLCILFFYDADDKRIECKGKCMPTTMTEVEELNCSNVM